MSEYVNIYEELEKRLAYEQVSVSVSIDADGNAHEYIGQDKVKENLSIFIKAALSRNEALDHVLLYGPPGLGKTTLANIIANELGVNFRVTSGPAIERSGDLAALLTNLTEKDVLFIDEIKRLSHSVEEVLLSSMGEYRSSSTRWERRCS